MVIKLLNKLLAPSLILIVQVSISQEINFPKFQKNDSVFTLENKLIHDEFFELEHTSSLFLKLNMRY